MNKSEAGKLGRAAVNTKYPLEIRLQWSRKGAQVLNSILLNETRVLGGKMQPREAKSLGAFNAAKVKKLNSLEEKVCEFLQLAKEIKFQSHAVVKTPARTFELDFVHFLEGKPKIVVEVTSLKSGLKAESIAYKAIKLKQFFPNIFFIAVVPSSLQFSGLASLTGECNRVVFSDNLKELPQILHLIN